MKVESYGKCPGCGQVTNTVKAGHIIVDVAPTTKWNGITYTCPKCNVILGVQIDPISIRTDIVNEVVEQLRKLK